MRELLVSVAGTFIGLSLTAFAVVFLGRIWVRQQVAEWAGDAHRKGICPVCKQPAKHEGPAPDEVA